MQIDAWMKARHTKGTLPYAVRRLLRKDPVLANAERTFRTMCVLEAVLRAGGNQRAAAEALGVCQHTVGRTINALGISAEHFRTVAKAVAKSEQ